MKVDLNRQQLTSLLTTVKPEFEICYEYEKQGLMFFSGDQWNPAWRWNGHELKKLSDNQIIALYNKHSNNGPIVLLDELPVKVVK